MFLPEAPATACGSGSGLRTGMSAQDASIFVDLVGGKTKLREELNRLREREEVQKAKEMEEAKKKEAEEKQQQSQDGFLSLFSREKKEKKPESSAEASSSVDPYAYQHGTPPSTGTRSPGESDGPSGGHSRPGPFYNW
ncbi:hypothetical protein B0T13DRAFT_513591 [Neurospora crassa]|nr:hypothetical protein B0T13DRAFT_513591 [Neurospora crassa]